MHQYSIANQNNGRGTDKVWGLTASYTRNSDGTYRLFRPQPNNDLGIITNCSFVTSSQNSYIIYMMKKVEIRVVNGSHDDAFHPYNWVTLDI
jgi:hypothetical protein